MALSVWKRLHKKGNRAGLRLLSGAAREELGPDSNCVRVQFLASEILVFVESMHSVERFEGVAWREDIGGGGCLVLEGLQDTIISRKLDEELVDLIQSVSMLLPNVNILESHL